MNDTYDKVFQMNTCTMYLALVTKVHNKWKTSLLCKGGVGDNPLLGHMSASPFCEPFYEDLENMWLKNRHLVLETIFRP